MKMTGFRGAVLAATALAVLGGWVLWPKQQEGAGQTGQTGADVVIPALVGQAAAGATLYDANCAQCHGNVAQGVEGAGPPFLNRIYEPGHHGDAAFYSAARIGVRAHHWRFGNMPPVAGVTETDVAAIIAYVRALQKANGVF